MEIVNTHKALRDSIALFKSQGKVIAFVPTMGALHEGHLRLVDAASKAADVVVCSIFVNPTQFAEGEDFGSYPRNEARDIALLKTRGADVVYLPVVEEIYPAGEKLPVPAVSNGTILEGAFRPHFFGGVAQVVTKLFEHVTPHKAFFGEKDYQQLHVIKHLVADNHMPIEVIGVPTARADDGLALSSRNVYLSEEERAIAPTLHQALVQVKNAISQGVDAQQACEQAYENLLAAGFASIDYLEVRDAETLSKEITIAPRVLVAAKLGTTRLIDNI